MLMRLFDTPDYERSLRRRRLAAFGLLAVGVTGIVCYLLLIHDSDVLSDYARGFYLGGASGITIGAVLLLARVTYLLSNPEDEREKSIVNQSFQFAGMFTFFAAAASMFVLVAVSREAAMAVFGVIVVYAVSWLLSNLYLSKTL